MWTGDIKSNYYGLKDNIAMMISLSLSGYSFIGCDIGGFAEEGSIKYIKGGIKMEFFIRFLEAIHMKVL